MLHRQTGLGRNLKAINIKRSVFCLWLALFVAIFSTQLRASDAYTQTVEFKHAFKHLSAKDQLSQNNIIDIIETPDGAIWLGTYNGLNRFDGVRVTPFSRANKSHSIFDDEIRALTLDNKGNLWVLSSQSIFMKNSDDQFEFFAKLSDLIPAQQITMANKINFSSDGDLWIYYSTGFTKVNIDTLTTLHQSTSSIAKNIFVFDVVWKESKQLLLTSFGLWFFDEQQGFHQPANLPQPLVNSPVTKIFEHNDGYLVIGFQFLFELTSDFEEISRLSFKSLGLSSPPMFATRSKANDLWLGTNSGLYHLKTNILTSSFDKHTKLDHYQTKGEEVSALFTDSNANLWFGSFLAGVYYLDSSASHFKQISSAVDIKGEVLIDASDIPSEATLSRIPTTNSQQIKAEFDLVISDISSDKDKLWLSNHKGHLYRYHLTEEKLTRVYYRKPDKRQSRPPYIETLSVVDDSVWIGSIKGLYQYNMATKSSKLWSADTVKNFPLFRIAEINPRSKQLWVSGKRQGGAIINLTTNKFKLYSDLSGWKDEWNSLSFLSIYHQNSKTFLGTYEGIMLEYDHQTQQMKQHSLFYSSRKMVHQITSTKDNQLLILSNDGLFEYKVSTEKLTLKLAPSKHGQISFFTMQVDNEKRIWLGANTGVVLFDQLSGYSILLDEKAGVLGDEYNHAHAKGDDGTIYLGGVGGLLQITPEEFELRAVSTKIQLAERHFFNPQSQSINTDQSVISSLIERPILKDGASILFQIKPEVANDVDKLNLRYRIDGHEWIALKNWEIKLHRYQFQPGKHQLEIQSTQIHDVHWQKALSFQFEVYSLFNLPSYVYWIISFSLGILLSYLIFTKLNVLKRLQKIATKEAEQQLEQILHKEDVFAQLLTNYTQWYSSLRLKRDYLQLQPTTDKQVVGYLDQLFTLYENSGKTISHILAGDKEELEDTDFKKLIQTQLIKQSQIQTNVGRGRFISESSPQALLLQINLFESLNQYFGDNKKIRLSLEKHSARRATVIIGLYGLRSEISEVKKETEQFLQLTCQAWELVNAVCEFQWRNQSLEISVILNIKQPWRGQKSIEVNQVSTTDAAFNVNDIGQGSIDLTLEPEIIIFDFQSDRVNYQGIKQVFRVHFFDDINKIELPNLMCDIKLDWLSSVIVYISSFNYDIKRQVSDVAKYLPSKIIILCELDVYQQLEVDLQMSEQFLVLPCNIPNQVLSNLCRFISHLNNKIQLTPLEVNDVNAIEFPILSKAESYLADFFADEALNLDKMASALYLSKRQLSQSIKQSTGLTALEFIKQYRVKRSLEMLKKGIPVSLVARHCGFSSQSYFSTCFKQFYGLPPKRFDELKSSELKVLS